MPTEFVSSVLVLNTKNHFGFVAVPRLSGTVRRNPDDAVLHGISKSLAVKVSGADNGDAGAFPVSVPFCNASISFAAATKLFRTAGDNTLALLAGTERSIVLAMGYAPTNRIWTRTFHFV
jgi:hypothetical protein